MIAVTDEIYEHIIYDGRPHVALAALDGMRDHAVTISGMSKTYAVTGWRVGTIIAAPHLTHAFRQVHDFVSIGAAAPFRKPARPRIDFPDRITAGSPPIIRRGVTGSARRSGKPASTSRRPKAPITSWLGSPHSGSDDDMEFSRYLVREIGVATVPGSSFFQDKALGRPYVRFCFCKRDSTLDAAAERLRKLRVIV